MSLYLEFALRVIPPENILAVVEAIEALAIPHSDRPGVSNSRMLCLPGIQRRVIDDKIAASDSRGMRADKSDIGYQAHEIGCSIYYQAAKSIIK